MAKLKPANLTKQERAKAIQTMMDDAGYNPIESMMEMTKLPNLTVTDKISLHKELAKYYAPQLKSVEVDVVGELGIQVHVLRFDANLPIEHKADHPTLTIVPEHATDVVETAKAKAVDPPMMKKSDGSKDHSSS